MVPSGQGKFGLDRGVWVGAGRRLIILDLWNGIQYLPNASPGFTTYRVRENGSETAHGWFNPNDASDVAVILTSIRGAGGKEAGTPSSERPCPPFLTGVWLPGFFQGELMRFDDLPTWKEWQKKSSSFLQKRSNKPKLVAIDNLVRDYWFTPPSEDRALLISLSNALYEWAQDKIDRAVDTGRLEAMRALEEVVQRKLNALVPQGYEEVVCIGYDIPCGEFQDVANRLGVVYRGLENDLKDVRGRCGVMKQAIRLAYQQYQLHLGRPDRDAIAYLGNHRPPREEPRKRLKIFMAPEFFFRGLSGAYDISMVSEVFQAMREETKDKKYADWLFVLGTVVCAAVKHSSGNVDTEKGMILDNIAVVQKGGFQQSDGVHDLYVEKEFPSSIDYDRPTTGVEGNWANPKRKVKIGGDDRRALAPPGSRDIGGGNPGSLNERTRGGCIFTMDGITFGLEVCLDHVVGRLHNAPDKDGVQIQLIPSAGAEIHKNHCSYNAVVFNVDGGDAHHAELFDKKTNTDCQETRRVEATPDYTHFPGVGHIVLFPALPIP
jgi:hypothetical protein